eukprot:m.96910 g.96910  ORF g.96910 m.96910 type:complete len:54 (-) comp26937_c0_seq3:149-310(-)
MSYTDVLHAGKNQFRHNNVFVKTSYVKNDRPRQSNFVRRRLVRENVDSNFSDL